jgi:hypothetical protein
MDQKVRDYFDELIRTHDVRDCFSPDCNRVVL